MMECSLPLRLIVFSHIDIAEMFVGALGRGDVEKAILPSVGVAAADRCTEDRRQDHGPEAPCALVDGTCSTSVQRILHIGVELEVFELFEEDEVDQLASDYVEENCGGCVVGEPRRCPSDVVQVGVEENAGRAAILRGWHHGQTIETAAKHSEYIAGSHDRRHLLHEDAGVFLLEDMSLAMLPATSHNNLLVVVHVGWDV